MKNNKIQSLRTSGIVSVLGLTAVVSLTVFWPWGLNTASLEKDRAKQKAEVIAYQIVQIYKEAKMESQDSGTAGQSRGLASVGGPNVSAGGVLTEFKNQGSMGVDPWGHPYQYRIVSQDSGSRLMVWSLGPNGSLDNQAFLSEDTKEALNETKHGDDIRVEIALTE